MVMMFPAPVSYPIIVLPEEYRHWLMVNPLTFLIEQARGTLIRGLLPDWAGAGIYAFVATVAIWVGNAWIQKNQKGIR